MYSEIVFQDRWIFYKHLFCKNSSEAFTKFNNLEAYTLMYNFRGDKKHLVEGNRYLINPGDMLITKPNEAFTRFVSLHDDSEYGVFIFMRSVIKQFDPKYLLLDKLDNREPGEANVLRFPDEIRNYVEFAIKSIDRNKDDYHKRLLIYATLLQLLEVIAHTEAIRIDPKPCEHREILAYINQDISLPHTNQSLANHFFMSESQFRRVFKQITGSTLTDYLNTKRVNCARQLIRTGTKAKDAAQAVGFNQYISFYNANKKLYVSTPSGEHPTEGNDPLLDNGFYGNTLDVQSYLSR